MRSSIAAFLVGTLLVSSFTPAHADERFQDSEVRVIKNKFFQKTLRPEIGLTSSAIMNEAFLNTFLGGAKLGLHFTESIGIYLDGAYGFMMTKENCDTLGEKFRIEPLVPIVKYIAGGGVSYTPIYGKYQLSSGDVLYFDTYFSLGGGVAGLARRDNKCVTDAEEKLSEIGATQFHFGVGQRFFMSTSVALGWQLNVYGVTPGKSPEGEESFSSMNFVNMLVGLTYFL